MINRNFLYVLLIVLIAVTLTTGCSSIPDEKQGKLEFQGMLDKYFPQRYSVESFIKTDGIPSERNGIKMYTMEFEADIKSLKKARGTISLLRMQSLRNIFGGEILQAILFLEKDKIAKIRGKLAFIKTEKGWRKN
jgi:hypothetical protein